MGVSLCKAVVPWWKHLDFLISGITRQPTGLILSLITVRDTTAQAGGAPGEARSWP